MVLRPPQLRRSQRRWVGRSPCTVRLITLGLSNFILGCVPSSTIGQLFIWICFLKCPRRNSRKSSLLVNCLTGRRVLCWRCSGLSFLRLLLSFLLLGLLRLRLRASWFTLQLIEDQLGFLDRKQGGSCHLLRSRCLAPILSIELIQHFLQNSKRWISHSASPAMLLQFPGLYRLENLQSRNCHTRPLHNWHAKNSKTNANKNVGKWPVKIHGVFSGFAGVFTQNSRKIHGQLFEQGGWHLVEPSHGSKSLMLYKGHLPQDLHIMVCSVKKCRPSI